MNPRDNSQQARQLGGAHQQHMQARPEGYDQAHLVKMPGLTQQPMKPTDKGKEIEVQNDLEDLNFHLEGPDGKDYSHLLGSGLRFEELGLPQDIVQALYRVNYKMPSNVQANVIPILMKEKHVNLVCQSQTGTGKTAAFVIGMLARVDVTQNCPQALCIAPTRELARQIISYTNDLAAENYSLETALAVPGPEFLRQKCNAHIIIGTPGTVVMAIQRKIIDPSNIKILVLDEADALLDQGDLSTQSLRLKRLVGPSAQVLMFSATFSDRVLEFSHDFCPNAAKLTLRKNELTLGNIKQIYMDCRDENQKYEVLVSLYHTMTIASSIIFVKRRNVADEIARRMKADGHVVHVLHSALDTTAERDNIIDQFRQGRIKVLITTNLLARGIDITTTSMVINYDLPRTVGNAPDYTTYLHRIGRTGRYGRAGVSISFVHDKDSWDELKDIQKYFGAPIHHVPADDIEVVEELIQKIIKSNQAYSQEAIHDLAKSRHAK
ncbi:ATP-dependent RNA helicase DBP5 [Pyronema omphalodes]|nr:ATP-dependent RNA helicase DBP5 [Pyronema omphalodes]